MKLRTPLLVLAASVVVACGGSDKPADDPSTTASAHDSTVVTPLPSDSTSSSTATSPASDMSASTGAGTTTSSGTAHGASSSGNHGSSQAGSGSGAAVPSPSSTDPGTVGAATPPATAGSPNADNTKTNDRDAHGGTLTPMNQGNSKSETDITAAIRKSVVGDGSLSFTAKNVKIITIGTKVTLRGPVKTDQEKATIEKWAKQAAGVTDVDDQIEVKK